MKLAQLEAEQMTALRACVNLIQNSAPAAEGQHIRSSSRTDEGKRGTREHIQVCIARGNEASMGAQDFGSIGRVISRLARSSVP